MSVDPLQVADVEVLVEPAAADKEVNIIANAETVLLPLSQLFKKVMLQSLAALDLNRLLLSFRV